VGKLVHQNDLRSAGNYGIEVHLLQPLCSVLDPPARNDLETLQKTFGFSPPVSFDYTDDHVIAVSPSSASLLQHFVGLAYARGSPDEYSELADTALLAPGRFEQSFRRGSLVGIAPHICHAPSVTRP
jgi:hypothetical protein